MTVLVSVVIPTFRRPQLLERCLQALLDQNFPPHAYEIIIVDDGPEDGATRALVDRCQQRLRNHYAMLLPAYSEKIPVTGAGMQTQTELSYTIQAELALHPHIIYLPAYDTQGPAAARNHGWQEASGEIIAFTDDDCIPDPNWLANGISAFVGNVAAVSGRVIVPINPQPTDNELNTTGLERSDFVTANCFYRRFVLEAVGGFDDRFRTAWREDSDLYFRVRKQNFTLAWAAGAVVVHPVRPEPWGSSLRSQRKSFYNALLYKKHPELYRLFIQSSPPWNYYAMVFSLLAALVGLLVAETPLVLVGLFLWLFLVGEFTLRRLAHTSHAPDHMLEMAVTSIIIPFLSIYWRIRGALHWRVFFL